MQTRAKIEQSAAVMYFVGLYRLWMMVRYRPHYNKWV